MDIDRFFVGFSCVFFLNVFKQIKLIGIRRTSPFLS